MAIVLTSIFGVHCECVCVDDWTAKKAIIVRNDDKNGKYDELCNKIYYKFRSNLNLPSDLNEQFTTEYYIY